MADYELMTNMRCMIFGLIWLFVTRNGVYSTMCSDTYSSSYTVVGMCTGGTVSGRAIIIDSQTATENDTECSCVLEAQGSFQLMSYGLIVPGFNGCGSRIDVSVASPLDTFSFTCSVGSSNNIDDGSTASIILRKTTSAASWDYCIIWQVSSSNESDTMTITCEGSSVPETSTLSATPLTSAPIPTTSTAIKTTVTSKTTSQAPVSTNLASPSASPTVSTPVTTSSSTQKMTTITASGSDSNVTTETSPIVTTQTPRRTTYSSTSHVDLSPSTETSPTPAVSTTPKPTTPPTSIKPTETAQTPHVDPSLSTRTSPALSTTQSHSTQKTSNKTTNTTPKPHVDPSISPQTSSSPVLSTTQKTSTQPTSDKTNETTPTHLVDTSLFTPESSTTQNVSTQPTSTEIKSTSMISTSSKIENTTAAVSTTLVPSSETHASPPTSMPTKPERTTDWSPSTEGTTTKRSISTTLHTDKTTVTELESTISTTATTTTSMPKTTATTAPTSASASTATSFQTTTQETTGITSEGTTIPPDETAGTIDKQSDKDRAKFEPLPVVLPLVAAVVLIIVMVLCFVFKHKRTQNQSYDTLKSRTYNGYDPSRHPEVGNTRAGPVATMAYENRTYEGDTQFGNRSHSPPAGITVSPIRDSFVFEDMDTSPGTSDLSGDRPEPDKPILTTFSRIAPNSQEISNNEQEENDLSEEAAARLIDIMTENK